MEKKHFMCTHTWGSDAVRDQVAEQSKEMTDVDFFALFKTEKAEVLQHLSLIHISEPTRH